MDGRFIIFTKAVLNAHAKSQWYAEQPSDYISAYFTELCNEVIFWNNFFINCDRDDDKNLKDDCLEFLKNFHDKIYLPELKEGCLQFPKEAFAMIQQ